MIKIGFLINPIAGIGGKVGLKGSDNVVEEALKRGGKEVAEKRAISFFKALDKETLSKAFFLTCSGKMGENVAKRFTKNYEIVYELKKEKTTASDTKKACEIFLEKKAKLIVFCGGDGTARDVAQVIRAEIPVLGIPSGVKMYSSCFGITPEASAKILEAFIANKTKLRDAEILDIDEEKYREDELNVKFFASVKTPYIPDLVQESKKFFSSVDEERIKKEIALFCLEFMQDSSLYLLGPGSTTKKICDLLGIEKTLLGVDAIKDNKLVGKDLSEAEILELLKKYKKAKIIVSPLGKQGFIFGRGNQQISSKVIKKVGVENVIIIATPQKLQETEKLFVDTGDKELDKKLSGHKQVICGYRLAQRKFVTTF